MKNWIHFHTVAGAMIHINLDKVDMVAYDLNQVMDAQ